MTMESEMEYCMMYDGCTLSLSECYVRTDDCDKLIQFRIGSY